MTTRLTAIGGLASAVLSIGAVVVAVVKWTQSAGDQIPPIFFSGALLFASLFALLLGAFLLVNSFREPKDPVGLRAIWVFDLLIGVAGLAIALPNDALHTLLHGRYRGNSDVIVPFGILGICIVGGGLVAGAVGYVRERSRPGWAPRGKQVCPDCAEYPKKDARVCRYCGYRFQSRPPAAGEAPRA